MTALAWLGQRYPTVELVGTGRAGLPALLARPFAGDVERTVVDLAGLDLRADNTFTAELAQPGLRRAGDFLTAALLSAPGALALHHAAGVDAAAVRRLSTAVNGTFHATPAELDAAGVVGWLSE